MEFPEERGIIVPSCQNYTQHMTRINSQFTTLRERAGLSVEEIAHRSGYHTRTIYRWEKGEGIPRKAVLDLLKTIIQTNEDKESASDFDFTFIDLFAGIGGTRKGFEAAGGKCVFTSEWDKYARQTYIANFGSDHPIAGDITKIKAIDIPSHDVLLAGFPCQPFSIAGVSKKNALGKKHGFEDKVQGTLFFDIVRILKEHQPVAFLLENVKNLLSHDKSNTFKTIREVLEVDLKYKISFHVIDGKGYVPQHRERLYIVGFKEDVGFNIHDIDVNPPNKGPLLKEILHPENGTEPEEEKYTCGKLAKVKGQYTLSPKLWNYLKDYAAKHKAKGNGFGFGLVSGSDTSRTLSARYYKDGSEILIKQKGKRPRRLTPRECSRLMGFDKPGQSHFNIPVSDTQAYKQFGNSVVVPVIEVIANHMKPYITNYIKSEMLQKKISISA